MGTEKIKDALLKTLSKHVLVADGAMGTMLYSKGIYINQSFEGLNLTNPALVEEIHREYLEAGAELIEANTYAANRLALKKFGLSDKTSEINIAGCQIARRATTSYPKINPWVAGSMGPLEGGLQPYGHLAETDAFSVYQEQAQALITGGIDLIVIETIPSIRMLTIAVEAVQSVSKLPIIAQLTINDELKTPVGDELTDIAKCFNDLPVDVVGFNCSEGPVKMLEALEIIRPLTHKYISIMPNAGRPGVYEGRRIYLASPEYMATYAKSLIQKGASIVGGCCGTTPAHIKLIKNAVRSVMPATSEHSIITTPSPKAKAVDVQVVPRERKSRLSKKMSEGKFVISVEVDPPRGTSLKKTLEAAELLHKNGIDLINIADGPRASARMSPMALATIFERDIGIETLIHYCCRDRNILGMQSDLIAAHSLGLRNILIITGDPPKLGDYPNATGVFDLDAIGLTKLANNLNHGIDIIGSPIGEPTSFYLAVGANPAPLNFDLEISRLEKKISAGAEFILTQPVYDQPTFERFIRATERFKTPILIGICPLASHRNAEFIHNEIPGMSIPQEIRNRMRRAETPEGQRDEGIAIAREALSACKPMVQGTYILPPLGKYDLAIEVCRGIAL